MSHPAQQAQATSDTFYLTMEAIADVSDEKLASFPKDYLSTLVKHIGDYQDYWDRMSALAEESMVRIEALMTI